VSEIDSAKLDTHGFQIFRELISFEAITSVRQFLEEELAHAIEILAPLGISGPDFESGLKAGKLLAGPEAEKIEEHVKSLLAGHFPLSSRLSERLWDLPKDSGLQSLLNFVFNGQPISMHMPPVARFVLPGNFGAAVPPHKDFDYNLHLNDFFTFWIPLVDIDRECGGISFYLKSGNHKLTFESEFREIESEEVDVLNSRFWLPALSTNSLNKIVCSPIFPGDVVVFNPEVVHGSELNNSSRTRLSVDMRFFRKNFGSRKHFLDLQEWRIVNP
jgi:hypothetical protein